MKCPNCGGETRVVNTYRPKKQKVIRRQRICKECNLRFPTYEEIAVKNHHGS